MLNLEFKDKLITSVYSSLKNTLSVSNTTPSDKSPNYLAKNVKDSDTIIEKINLFQLKQQDTSQSVYSDVFDFLSKDPPSLVSTPPSLVSTPHTSSFHTDVPIELLKPNNTKQRRSIGVDISYGKFIKTDSKQSHYKPNHDQKIQIMNTFFGGISTKNNYDKIYSSLNTIPAYRGGGTISKPTIVVAGEKGAERITPVNQSGSAITPSNDQATPPPIIKPNPTSSGSSNDSNNSNKQDKSNNSKDTHKSTVGSVYTPPYSINILLDNMSTNGLPRFETL